VFDVAKEFAVQYGAFGTVCVVMGWMINYLSKELGRERERNVSMTEKVINNMPLMAGAIADLSTTIKMSWGKK
jgi:hypothetical protein